VKSETGKPGEVRRGAGIAVTAKRRVVGDGMIGNLYAVNRETCRVPDDGTAQPVEQSFGRSQSAHSSDETS
jgi:hypothetical protein